MPGKTTLAKLLAEALQVPKTSLDDLRWPYVKESGYDKDCVNYFIDSLEDNIIYCAMGSVNCA